MCKRNTKWTIDEIKIWLKNNEPSYTLLSTEYINAKTHLLFMCPDGHTFSSSWDNFKNSKSRCANCDDVLKADQSRIPISKIMEELYNRQLEFMGWIDEYKNRRSKFLVKGLCSHIYATCTDRAISRNCGCPFCNGGVKMDGKFVYEAFADRGFQPLFKPEDYENNIQELPFKCNKHHGEIQYTNWMKFKIDLFGGCKYCYLDSRTGENSPQWKGGITPIHVHLRNLIYEWKILSIKICNAKCIITGDTFDNIHHLHSFDTILREIISKNNIQIKPDIKDYTVTELELLSSECLSFHKYYGEGACLNKDIHTLFHKEYGYGNNTHEQFKEFLTRLMQGEFYDFLKENNLELNINFSIIDDIYNKIA